MSVPTIGVVGRDVPIELIEAHGASVRRLELVATSITAEADDILGRGVDPAATAMLSAILDGAVEGWAGIVLCSDSDATQRLFHALRLLARVGAERRVPPVHIVDVLHLPRPASLAYSRDELAALCVRLREWTGVTPSPTQLVRTIRGRDEVRRGLTRVSDRRPEVTGTDFFHLRSQCDELGWEYALTRVLAVPATRREPDPRIRVALTGSSQYGASVVDRIERSGAVVVADDCAGGRLGLSVAPREPTIDALAERYVRDGQTAHRGSAPERAAALVDAAERAGARAIISYARRRDDAVQWDRWALSAATKLPLIVLDDQDFDALDETRLRTELSRIGADHAR